MNRKGLLGLAFAGLFAVASAHGAAKIELVSAEDYGTEWPFVPSEMHLLCLPGNAVVVSDPESGQMYALNGTASGRAAALALEPLDKVWRQDPANPGAKVSVSPFISKGLTLCQ
jgi:hypothetical protein